MLVASGAAIDATSRVSTRVSSDTDIVAGAYLGFGSGGSSFKIH